MDYVDILELMKLTSGPGWPYEGGNGDNILYMDPKQEVEDESVESFLKKFSPGTKPEESSEFAEFEEEKHTKRGADDVDLEIIEPNFSDSEEDDVQPDLVVLEPDLSDEEELELPSENKVNDLIKKFRDRKSQNK